MNHIYRIIWNRATSTWVAVSEISHGRGKAGAGVSRRSRPSRTAFSTLAGAVFVLNPVAVATWAQSVTVAPGSGLTSTYVAPNGVTVVDIDKANAAGLSHNRYGRFDVEAKGLVLNNTTNTGGIAYNSQLAGQVMANMNAVQSARVILNEVVGNNRSRLAGFTEVLGGKADVVVANPYGITCSGCGFINTDRVTLTTGTPNLGSDGALMGFTVNRGDILIDALGLNASAQQILDLVARSVRLDGRINAQDLGISAGAQTWGYAGRVVTAGANGSDATPSWAIDSSVLGGMYANRIRLVATEAGVGVRMRGDAAATAEDFSLDAAGRVELQTAISAQRDVRIQGTGALALTQASLAARRDIGLSSQAALELSGGSIVADAALSIQAASLTDAVGDAAAAAAPARSAGTRVQVSVSGAAQIGATPWQAQGSMQVQAGTLSTVVGTTLRSGAALDLRTTVGDMNLDAATLLARDAMLLDSAGRIDVTAGANQALQSTTGTVTMLAGRGLSNAGSVSADQGALTIRANGQVRNTGALNAATALTLSDRDGGASESFDNAGRVLAASADLQGAALSNAAGARIDVQGGSRIAGTTLTNAGVWLLSAVPGAADTLTFSGELSNLGTLQSAGSLALAGNVLLNSGQWLAADVFDARLSGNLDNAGLLQARQITTAAAGQIRNFASATIAAESLALKAGSGLENAGLVDARAGSATLGVDGALRNTGTLQASGDLSIAGRSAGAAPSIDNAGKLLAGGRMQVRAAELHNRAEGWIQATLGSRIDAASIDNAGTWLSSTQDSGSVDAFHASGSFAQTGVSYSKQSLDIGAANLAVDGEMVAADALTVDASAAARIATTGRLAGATFKLAAGQGLDQFGIVRAERGSAVLRVDGRLSNAGTIHASGTLDIGARGADAAQLTLNNASTGLLLTDADLLLGGGAVTNQVGGRIQAAARSEIAATSLNNAGQWTTSTAASGRADVLRVAGIIENAGELASGHELDAQAGSAFANRAGAQIQAQQLRLSAGGLDNSGVISAASGDLTARVDGTIRNAGSIQAAGSVDLADRSGAGAGLDIVNTGTGEVLAGAWLLTQARGVDNQVGGWIQSKDRTLVQAATLTNAGTLLASTDAAGGPAPSGSMLTRVASLAQPPAVGSADGLLVSGALTNGGLLQSAHDLQLRTGALDNAGRLLSGGTLTLDAAGPLRNRSSGVIYADSRAVLQTVAAYVGDVGSMIGADDIALTAGASSSHAGQLTASLGNATIHVNGALSNSGALQATNRVEIADGSGAAAGLRLTNTETGLIRSLGDLVVRATAVENQRSASDLTRFGWIEANRASQVQASSLVNRGTWLLSTAGNAPSTVSVSTALTNDGSLQSLGLMTLTAGSVSNSGRLLVGDALSVATTGNLGNAATGTVYAGGAATFTIGGLWSHAAGAVTRAGSLDLSASGVPAAMHDIFGTVQSSAGTLRLRLNGPVTNRGTLNAFGLLDIGDAAGGSAQIDLSNAGTMLAGADIQLDVGTLANQAGAGIQAGGASRIQARSLSNDGWWNAGLDANRTSTLSIAQAIDNRGTLQSAGSIAASAASVDNRANARWIAARDLRVSGVSGAAGFSNAGLMQSGQTLEVASGSVTLHNAAGATMVAATALVADVGSLVNDGAMQGGGGAANRIRTAQDLTNHGTMTLATAPGGAGAIDADRIVNDGTMQSLGALALTIGGGGLAQSGSLVSDGAMSWAARGGQTYGSVLADGSVTQTASWLDAGGFGSLSLSGSALLRAGSGLALKNGGSIAMDSRSVLFAGGTLDVDVQALTLSANGAQTSRILGSMIDQGVSKISLAQPLDSHGLLFSSGDLQLTAPRVNNTTTGGIAALRDLTVHATSGDASVDATAMDNSGALYAGGALTVNATAGTLRNRADAAGVRYLGTIDARDITLVAGNLINNSTVNALGSLTINAELVLNEHIQASSRSSSESAKTTVETYSSGKGYHGCGCADHTEWWDYRQTWSVQQQLAGGTPSASIKPLLLAGSRLEIDFNLAKNAGGVISAQEVNLQGRAGLLATPAFLNDSLDLTRTDYTRTYTEFTKYKAAGPETYYTRQLRNDTTVSATVTTFSLGAGIFATQLTGGNFGLTNAGSPYQLASSAFSRDTSAGSAQAAGTTQASAMDASRSAGSISVSLASDSRSVDAPVGGLTTGMRDRVIGSTRPTVDSAAVASATRPRLPPPPLTFATFNASQGVQGTSFGGITAQLPSNPNGYFVATRTPQAQYKVEANPLYMVGSSSVGSTYLYERLGFDPDQMTRRLGDSNYEAQLVRQQLVAQTGNVLLAGYSNASAQMQALFDHATELSSAMALQFGKALTAEQQAMLPSDIVWMVQSVIDGESLLVPVVYLSPATKSGIVHGAVVSAENAQLNLVSLTNTGGTIIGSKSLVIASTGDIKNLSGTIKGGDVSLTSTEGSILNETFAQGSGSERFYRTEIGRSAGIESTGSLLLDAKKDIRNIGAQITAGGDATLKAGRDVVFDTIANKSTDTRSSGSGGAFSSDITTTRTSTTTQIKSGLTVGGSLTAQAARDITLAGTDVKVAGDADVKAGNNLNIIARENSSSSHSERKSSGAFQNGALYSSTDTTTDSLSVRNVGSTFTVGGNAQLGAGKDLTVQGSDIQVAGKGGIEAGGDIKVLAGRNYDETRTTTTSTRIGTFDLSSGKQTDAGAQADASAGTDRAARVNGSAAAGSAGAGAGSSAGAQAGASATGELTLASTSTTTTTTTDLRHVGSTISFGGDMTVKGKDVTLQGAKVQAGGDLDVDAQNVRLLAAEDRKTSSTTTTTARIGLMAQSDNGASAGASASAQAQAQGSASGRRTQASGSASADAQAQADAQVQTRNTLDVARVQVTGEETLQTRNQGSTLSSGGSMKIKAANELRLKGSNVEAGQDLDVSARKITSVAVSDRDEKRTTRHDAAVGLYLDAEGSAQAQAQAKAGAEAGVSKGTLLKGSEVPGSAQAGASASAEAKGSADVGVQARYSSREEVQGSTTAVVSSFKSGGNMRRNASETITDVGTAIEAAGDFAQSATTIVSRAAENTTYASSTNRGGSVRIGAFAEGDASAGAGAQVSTAGEKSKQTESGANAGAGARVRAQYGQASETSESSTAVVSTIKVGGKASSRSAGTTTLEGTQIEAGGDVALDAAKLEFKAAADTTRESATSREGSIDAKADAVNKSAKVDASYAGADSSASSSTAVVGSIRSGGSTRLSSSGDMRLEGTQIDSEGSTSLKAGGTLAFDAARNTSQSESTELGASLSVTAAKKSGGATVGVQQGLERESSSADVAGGVRSRGALTIESGAAASFTGTELSGGQGVDISAKDGVAFKAAETRETRQSVSTDVSVTASGSKGKKETKAAGGVEIGVEGALSESTSQTGGSIRSDGGAIRIRSGGDASFTGTAIEGSAGVDIDAKGNARFDAARSTQTSTGFDVSVSGSGSMEKSSTTERTKNEDGSRNTTRTKTSSRSGEVSAGVGVEHASSSEETGGSITSTNGAVRVRSGGDVAFTGTALAGEKGVDVAAAGDLAFQAARSTSSSQAGSLSVGASASQSEERKSEGTNAKDGSWTRQQTRTRESAKSGQVSAEIEVQDSTQARGATVQSGSAGIRLSSGNNTTLEGAQIDAAQAVAIQAGGRVEQKDAVSQSIGVTASAGASGSNSTTRTDTTTDGKGQKAQTDSSTQHQVASARDGDIDGDFSRSSQATQIRGSSVVVTQGAGQPGSVVRASVPVVAGQSLAASTADGRPLPAWLKFDPKTGTLEGTPPAGFKGSLQIVVSARQADGTVKQIPMTFGGP